MKIEALRERLSRIYVDRWPFHQEHPDYFALKQRHGEGLRDALQAAIRRKVTFMQPANDQNFYLVGASLSKIRRYRFEIWEVEGEVDAWYVECLHSVVAPVIELSYHHYQSRDDALEHLHVAPGSWNPEEHPLKGPALEAALARFAGGIGHAILSRSELEIPAPTDFPSLGVWDGSPRSLRDYVFPGALD